MKYPNHLLVYRFSWFIWIFFVLASFLFFTFIFDLSYYLTIEDSLMIINLFIALNIASFLLFGFDKIQSISSDWRVPENILYFVTFLGGSIGSILGMFIFRHKTRKTRFQLVIALLVFIHLFSLKFLPEFLTSFF